jgi:hypothetical protein
MAESNVDIHRRINELIDEEHRLRANEEGLADGERRQRLELLETELDQVWDLLRQREARREFRQDPERAHERSTRMVEGYEN